MKEVKEAHLLFWSNILSWGKNFIISAKVANLITTTNMYIRIYIYCPDSVLMGQDYLAVVAYLTIFLYSYICCFFEFLLGTN